VSLSPNPLAKLVTQVSSTISTASSQAGVAFNQAKPDLGKLKLDSKMADLSGASGNALGSFTSSNGIGDLKNIGTAMGGAISGAISGAAGAAQSLVKKVGSFAGSTSNITADIASSVSKLGGVGGLAGGLVNAASKISGVAGQINNLLSMARASNLPAGGEAFQSRGPAVSMEAIPDNDWRVRINCSWSFFNSPLFNVLKDTGGVVWPYLPSITLATKANYNTVDPVHNNFPFQAYKNSQVDDITITGEFSAETERDALYWIAATTFFKTATKMFYGNSMYQGNPPIVCQLNGYGSSVFNNVPVVIKSFQVDFKDDVNYVKCQLEPLAKPSWVPVLSTITVVVSPIYNRSLMRQFSLQDFAAGNTVGYL
jgi:hypothetical protein